jgi:CubicO group peptidase (beta-lactamase class C family)
MLIGNQAEPASYMYHICRNGAPGRHEKSQGVVMINRLWGCTAVALVAMVLVICAGQPILAQDFEQKLDEYLTASQQVYQFSGTALVAKDGKVILAKGYGMADREKSIPNTVDTRFQIGSVTKQFTSTAIMQLVAAGKIGLDDPAVKYLADFPKGSWDNITIRHLLCHQSGIHNYTDIGGFMAQRAEPITIPELIAKFKDLPLEFEPGSQFKYSNSGYAVLGVILEKVSGEKYADYLQKHIFNVVGMKNSGYLDYSLPLLATGYQTDTTKQVAPSIKVTPNMPYAAGALYSTVGDMLLWDRALNGETIVSQSTLKQMWTANKDNYGFGWVVDTLYKHPRVWHNGGIDGFVSEFHRYPNDGVCIVLFSNNASAPSGQMAAALGAIMLSQPYSVPVIKTAVKIDAAKLADYVGVYEIPQKGYRLITRQGDSLFSQRTGGATRLVLPEATDRFFFEYDNAIVLDFVRDAAGKVVAHKITQFGQTDGATLITGALADSLMKASTVASVDPAVYDQLVGTYELGPGFNIDVRRKENGIFIQATGQGEVEAFPRTETEYFLKVVDAQISFIKDSSGKVTSLVLHQGGRDLPAPRVK